MAAASSAIPVTWAQLNEAVSDSGDAYLTTMETLRLLQGAQRVGPLVQDSIHDRLAFYGLGHLPELLPDRGGDPVIVFRRVAPAGQVIDVLRSQGKASLKSVTSAMQLLNRAGHGTGAWRAEVVARASAASAELEALLGLVEGPPE